MYQKGRALHQLDRKDEALEVYNLAKKGTDESAAASLFMIGEIQFERKQHEEAIRTFYDVRLNYPFPKWQADATYEAARCFEVLKNVPSAVKLYQELIKKYPKSDKVPLAEERLKALQ
jgi:TolA-binding protein